MRRPRFGSWAVVGKTNWATLFASANQKWRTPRALFDALNKRFKFTLDPCCLPGVAPPLCRFFFTPRQNGLRRSWGKHRVYCNPPYKFVYLWLEKAYESSLHGALVVVLIPARPDTLAWHSFAMKADEIIFIKGRLHFSESKSGAPFPSAVLVFKPKNRNRISLQSNRRDQ